MQEIFLLEDLLNGLIELETLGNDHYTQMAEMVVNHELKDLFTLLAKQENAHKEIYKGYKENKINFANNEVSDEYQAYIEVLLKNTISFLKERKKIDDFESGFEMAILLEKETLLFLSEMKQVLTQECHPEIDLIMDQERSHLRYLLAYK